MPASRIYGMTEAFDRACVDLKIVANRAAAFMITDRIIRNGYIYETDKLITDYQYHFNHEVNNPFRQGIILDNLQKELSLTHREYQILRMKDYTTYIITDVFEEHGVIKYGKIAIGFLSGGLQAVAGASLFIAGRKMHVKKFQGAGIILFSHGGNNIYESVSPLIYKSARSGPLRKIYRAAASLSGQDKNSGDLAYSTADLVISAYAAARSPVLSNSSKRLIEKSIFEKPTQGRLFRAISSDYIIKWKNKSTPMKLYFVGDTLRKATMEIPLDGYKKDY